MKTKKIYLVEEVNDWGFPEMTTAFKNPDKCLSWLEEQGYTVRLSHTEYMRPDEEWERALIHTIILYI